MSERNVADSSVVVEKAKTIWANYNKIIVYGGTAVILIMAGWIGYQKFYKEPRELEAGETIFQAESLFGKMASTGFNKDSVNIVLNGGKLDGTNVTGILKVISKFDGTLTADRARYIAGACYLHIGEFDKAISNLKAFDGGNASQVKSKAFILLGHAYAEKNQVNDAMDNYKKAAEVNEKDEAITPDALMLCGSYAEANEKKSEAVGFFSKLKENFPTYISVSNGDVDKHLARLGEFK
jgi:TolA-binding protein